jgi:hypothetical protein
MWATIFWPVCSDLQYVPKVICEKPNRGNWYKNRTFLEHYFDSYNCSIGKLFTPLKTINFSDHFYVLHIGMQPTEIISKNVTKKNILSFFATKCIYYSSSSFSEVLFKLAKHEYFVQFVIKITWQRRNAKKYFLSHTYTASAPSCGKYGRFIIAV